MELIKCLNRHYVQAHKIILEQMDEPEKKCEQLARKAFSAAQLVIQMSKKQEEKNEQ